MRILRRIGLMCVAASFLAGAAGAQEIVIENTVSGMISTTT